MQIDFTYAQPMIRNTLDRAFTKKVGTKQGRAALAKLLCSKVNCGSQNVVLMIWAIDYATKWGKA